MRTSLMFVSMLSCSLMATACGPNPADSDQSSPRIDIDVPTENIPADVLKNVIWDLADMSLKGEKVEVSFADFLAKVPLPADFEPYADLILDSRDEMMEIECQGFSCVGSSSGRDIQFKLDNVDIPILGNPTILLSPSIKVNYRFNEDLSLLELCRISGIRVRSGLITQNVDGAKIVMGKDDQVESIKVDVGFAGSYPINSCDF